jgi:hypothetical protein
MASILSIPKERQSIEFDNVYNKLGTNKLMKQTNIATLEGNVLHFKSLENEYVNSDETLYTTRKPKLTAKIQAYKRKYLGLKVRNI